MFLNYHGNKYNYVAPENFNVKHDFLPLVFEEAAAHRHQREIKGLAPAPPRAPSPPCLTHLQSRSVPIGKDCSHEPLSVRNKQYES